MVDAADSQLPILIDFGSVGAARIKASSREEATILQDQFAQTVTATFKPPELFEIAVGRELDERSDIWSLGCTFYSLLYMSEHPFEGDLSPFDGSATAAHSGRYSKNCYLRHWRSNSR
jgi:serine/threonine kinase 16